MSAIPMKRAAEGGASSAAPRHFLELEEVPAESLHAMLAESHRRKALRAGLPKGASDADSPLDGRMLALLFEKPSTRTRVSFEMAIRQLGGGALTLRSGDIQLGQGETIADTARVLSGYVDVVMLRTARAEALRELAAHATIPVINGLTDRSHPCQIMADLMTIEEAHGRIKGLKIAWFGDGNNVAETWIQAAPIFGFELALATPEALRPPAEIVSAAQAKGAAVSFEEDVAAAAAGADVIVTDAWVSMHTPEAARAKQIALLRPYQVTAEVMARANPNAVFMHCLPAHRGEEATAEVMDGPQSIIFKEAENRLHAQKSVLLWCFGAL